MRSAALGPIILHARPAQWAGPSVLTHLHSRDAARPPARHWRCATVTKLHSQAIHAIVMFFNDTLNMLNIGLSTFFCSMLLTIAEMHVLATLIITTFSTTTAIATIDGVVTEPPRSNFFGPPSARYRWARQERRNITEPKARTRANTGTERTRDVTLRL